MSDPVDDLILDLLEWIGSGPRPYREVMDAWKTSCPRLTVWEDANDRGYITRDRKLVAVSDAGAAHLRRARSLSI